MISVFMKNDLEIPYQVLDENEKPVNLTDLDVVFVVARHPSMNGILIEKRIGNGIDLVDAENGEITITLDNQDTDLIRRFYKYELVIIDVDEHRYTATQGWLEIKNSITKEVI